MRWSLALALVVLTTAMAETPPTHESVTNAPMGYRVGVPGGWSAEASPDGLFLSILPREGTPGVGRAAITVAVEPGYDGTLDQGVEEVLDGLRVNMPDLRIVSRAPASVSGRPAAIVEVQGSRESYDVGYRMVFVVADGRGYVLFLEALAEDMASAAGPFDQVVASFTLTDAAVAPSSDRAGAYAGDGLTLTIEAAGPDGVHAGTLRHGEAIYPIAARTTPTGLAGTFASGGHAFDFVATLDRGVLHFITGRAAYTLTLQAPAAAQPTAPPAAAQPTAPPVAAPPTAPPGAAQPLAPPGAPAGAVAQVPDPCLLLTLLPAAAAAGPPPAIATGTRLVYYSAAASIPGERTQLVQDANGDWVDRATGARLGEQDVPGPAGEGFEVLQVGYLDGEVAQFSRRHYLLDRGSGHSTYMGESGSVTHAGCGGDFWVHPQALAALADMDEGGVLVLRMPYRLGERTFDAIRIHTTTGSGFVAYVYDLASGLLLYAGSSTVGAGVTTPHAGVGTAGRGSTQLTNVWMVDVQAIDVPWRDAPTPAWVAGLQSLDYQGTVSVLWPDPSMPVFPIPVEVRVSAGQRGRDWLRVSSVRSLASGQGLPTQRDEFVTSHGPASIGGLWIAPEALARLREGQPIERCEAVGYTTDVGAIGPASVTIREVGPRHRIEYVYDTRTGILTGTVTTQAVGQAQHVTELRLVGWP